MLRAYRYRLKPDKKMQAGFQQDFGAVRFVHNKALEYRSKAYKRRGESKNYHDTRELLNTLKSNMPWLKDTYSQSLQMVERPLMTPDELKSIPKGHFVVMKTGCHPMQTRLRLFLEWGITFEKEGYTVPVHENMQVHYAGRKELEESILCHSRKNIASEKADTAPLQNGGQEITEEDGHTRPSDDSSLRT